MSSGDNIAQDSNLPQTLQEEILWTPAPEWELPQHLKDNPYAKLSQEELMELYTEMMKNPEKYSKPVPMETTDEDGNPIIDHEGGATIQPTPGFVVKTKDQTGTKIFINMVAHELVEKMEQKDLPDQD